MDQIDVVRYLDPLMIARALFTIYDRRHDSYVSRSIDDSARIVYHTNCATIQIARTVRSVEIATVCRIETASTLIETALTLSTVSLCLLYEFI